MDAKGHFITEHCTNDQLDYILVKHTIVTHI